MAAFFILLFIVLFVLATDLVPQFYVWQSRIHIGRWLITDKWKDKVLQKSEHWLKNTPTIPLTDNKRLIVIDKLKGKYKVHSIQHWQEAALLLGLISVYEKTGDKNIKKKIDSFIDGKMDASGNWKNPPNEIDGVILAYAILKVGWIDIVINRPAFDHIWGMIQKSVGSDGTVKYRKHIADFRYVDTIGFICPFLIRYGVLFGNNEAMALGCKQITEFNKRGMFPEKFIPCHTYNTDSGVPVGLFGWGRGLGWYAIGLIDAWNELPDSDIMKPILTASVIAFAKMAISFQNEKGGWNWIVMNSHAITDSSATATLLWFLSNAAKINDIRSDCEKSCLSATTYLMKVTRRDGAIDLSQGDTKGIGIYSREFNILPFTQGFALRTIYL
jgi:unsaturated rhamnogalacturonyl hydrolase